MIIKPTAAITAIASTDILTGLSCRFSIASPQSTIVPVHNYKMDLYQGINAMPIWIQTLSVWVKSPSDYTWNVWAKIPLGYSENIKYGHIDLMRYLGVNQLDLSTVNLGLQAEYLQGGDDVLVLVGLAKVAAASLIPDDFLPY